MKPMNSVSIGSSDLGTPGYNISSSDPDAGMLSSSDPSKNPVEYVSTGGPKEFGQDEQISSDVPKDSMVTMHQAMLRRLAQFFTK